MEKSKAILKKRKFKRTFNRKLTLRDLAVLDFLWTWKVATTPMLKEVGFKNKSQWWVYKALRQLKNEKLIQLLPRGKHLDLELWALTEAGFEVVLMDRDDIAHYRYKPHAPAHDFLATCLQLGSYWQSGVVCEYLTEQMLSSLNPWNFPKGVRDTEHHIPDGITIFGDGKQSLVVGYEVDLNLKEEGRYQNTSFYYGKYGANPSLVIWLVKNEWIADRIMQVLKACAANDYAAHSVRFAFVLLEDFKKNLWEARAINSSVLGMSISKLHANALQSMGKSAPNTGQKSFAPIFFPKHRSPQKLRTYQSQGFLKIHQHPSGPGGNNPEGMHSTETENKKSEEIINELE